VTISTTSALADTHLVLANRLKQRDSNALADLYDQFSPLLLGVIRCHITDQHQAEALLNKAFLTIWAQAAEFDTNKEKLSIWMIRIARTIAIQEKTPKFVADSIQIPRFPVNNSNQVEEKPPSALNLVLFQGLNITEAALQLNISKQAVQKQLRQEILNHRNTQSND
jgi:DNA-directed RNA polymerase specialized sigma24 family protein